MENEVYRITNSGSRDPAYDVTPAGVENRVYELAKIIASRVEKSTLSESFKKSTASRLRNLKVLTERAIAREPDLGNQVVYSAVFNAVCGSFTVIQAVATIIPKPSDIVYTVTKTAESGIHYSKESGLLTGAVPQPIFVICPGLIATAANLPYKRLGVDFVLAHELSHAISFPVPKEFDKEYQKPTPQGLDPASLAEQSPLLSCLYRNYADRFNSLSAIKTRFEKQSELIVDLSNRMQSQAYAMSINYEDALKNYRQYFNREPNSVESHASEIFADYWATSAVASDFKVVENFELTLASYMNLFCGLSGQSNEFSKNFPDGDEGVHPALSFRIENFSRHPDISVYSRGSTEGLWCGI